MSKHGLKVADKTVFSIKTPDRALELMASVVDQYFGEYWTQHKPRCPLCNNGLSDTEKHMNRPVGECTNEKCDSTIHVSDFMGKLKDILGEWALAKDGWMEELQVELRKKLKTKEPTTSGMPTASSGYSDTDAELVDEETVFVW